jgi:hypothetical protein
MHLIFVNSHRVWWNTILSNSITDMNNNRRSKNSNATKPVYKLVSRVIETTNPQQTTNPDDIAKVSTQSLTNKFEHLSLSSNTENIPAEELLKGYIPTRLGLFSLLLTKNNTLQNHMNITSYLQHVNLKPKLPIYQPPKLPLILRPKKKAFFYKVHPTSVVPILLCAHQAKIQITDFDFVTERGNINKIMQRSENWTMAVQRINNTVFLRRCIDRKSVNYNDSGYLFEQACVISNTEKATTSNNNNTVQPQRTETFCLLSATVGKYSVLLSAEVDAFDTNRQPMELKLVAPKTWSMAKKKHEVWVQSFTAGVKTLIRGIRAIEKPANSNGIDSKNSNDRHSTKRRARPVTLSTIEKIEEVAVDGLCSKTKQCQSIYLLTQILTFLKEQSIEGVVYHLKREKNSDTKECTISLYQIHNNEQFITKQLLDDVKNIVLIE